MKGKEKCRILKEIRQQIAQQNHIAFVTSECKHKGDCTGTCPKCEQELRYLEKELEKRKSAGKAIAVAGIAAALMVSAAGCGGAGGTVQTTASEASEFTETAQMPGTEFMGAPTEPLVLGEYPEDWIEGRYPAPTEATTEATEPILMGDVPYEEIAP